MRYKIVNFRQPTSNRSSDRVHNKNDVGLEANRKFVFAIYGRSRSEWCVMKNWKLFATTSYIRAWIHDDFIDPKNRTRGNSRLIYVYYTYVFRLCCSFMYRLKIWKLTVARCRISIIIFPWYWNEQHITTLARFNQFYTEYGRSTKLSRKKAQLL